MPTETIYKPSEVQDLLESLITSNDSLMKSGQLPVSLSLVGPPGIGKTTIVRELTTKLKRGFYKLNLAQLTEPSELIGYYSKEYLMTKQGVESEYVTENLLPYYIEKGYSKGKSITRPCPPEWVSSLEDNSILLLDDYSRGNPLFSQAIMELVNEQTMVGWDLKGKNIQIILTENPDDGENNVASMDQAQADRMMRINMKWDASDWAIRAEGHTDERLINFVLWAPELFEKKTKDGISASGNVSPRMMDKFFNLIGTIPSFEKNLDRITSFGDISVGTSVYTQLINFINKNLDKLPSMDKLLLEYDEKTAKAELTKACGDYIGNPVDFKNATAAILTVRMYNYARHNKSKMTKDKIKHYLSLLLHTSFSEDQKYQLVKNTITINNNFGSVLASSPEFLKYMTS